MAQEMVDSGTVEASGGVGAVASLIAQTLISDLRIEDEIDAEARERLLRQRHLPPEGSGEYEAMFLREKEAVAARRGWPL